MKKILSLALASFFIFALTACSGSTGNKMADGTYTAQADDSYVTNFGYGWRDTLTVTIKDGKITEATFDSFNAEGQSKTAAGAYDMTPAPSEWMPELSDNVKNSVDGKVDGVAGATNSSKNAAELLAAIMSNGKPGETISVSLSAPEGK